MPDHPSVVEGVLRRPFSEQVAYFRGKLGSLVPTSAWDDLDREQHDTAFMVVGAQKADLLADLAASVDRAIVEGKSLDAFRRDFDAAVDRNDWHGWTGEGTKGGRAWRTRTIYRTNATVSYAAGRRVQLEAGNYAFWVYRHGNSQEPRLEHLGWNGLALEPDHPFWLTHYPPSDWGCSCYVNGARTRAAIRRLGGDPDKPLPNGWRDVDPRTGAPVGIGKGWDYAPGASVSRTVATMADKVRQWDYQIGKAFMAELPAANRDAIAEAYRRLPSVADDARRYARRVLGEGGDAVIQPTWTLGGVTTEQAHSIGRAAQGLKDDLAGVDFSLSPVDIQRNAIEQSEAGGSVSIDSYAQLPAVVDAPDEVTSAGRSATGEQLVRFVKTIAGVRLVAVFALRGTSRTLALVTFEVEAA